MLLMNSGPHCKRKLSRDFLILQIYFIQGQLLDLQLVLLLFSGLLLETHLRFMVRKV